MEKYAVSYIVENINDNRVFLCKILKHFLAIIPFSNLQQALTEIKAIKTLKTRERCRVLSLRVVED